ncbi:MAG: tripartite tricarboxylate transporter substrate binding protein [Pleomorphochaeta sp.]
MKKNIKLITILLSLLLLLASCNKTETTNTAAADSNQKQTEESSGLDGYPKKSIEFLIPAPAGGLVDIAMRSLADIVDFGKPVAVVNRAGAGQSIGLTEVVLNEADGYTITAAGFAGYIIQPNMVDLTYSVDDFRYLAVNNPPEPQIIISSADSKYKTWEDITNALENGETVSYSAANSTGFGRIVMLEVTSQQNIEPKFLPFSGSAEGFAALLGGQIDFYIIDASVAVPRILNNQFTGLMVASDKRLDTVPEVPSAKELGLENMEDLMGYTAIAVKKDTPDAIVDYIKEKIDEAQQSDAYKEYLTNVIGTNSEMPNYTEEEVTELIYNSYEIITRNMDKFNLGK